jgi:hypothetical protein
MRRSGAGLTLIASTQRSVLEIQMVCLVIDGPPAPPMGAPSIFLVGFRPPRAQLKSARGLYACEA